MTKYSCYRFPKSGETSQTVINQTTTVLPVLITCGRCTCMRACVRACLCTCLFMSVHVLCAYGPPVHAYTLIFDVIIYQYNYILTA